MAKLAIPICANCGRGLPRGSPPIVLRHRRTGEAKRTWLCDDCKAGEDRTWRLAWAIEREAAR